MNAIDTNVLLYSVDRSEPVKQGKAQQLLRQLGSDTGPTVLLWQVLGELTQQLRRWRGQGKLTADELSRHVLTFRQLFPLVLPTVRAFDAAMDLAERYSLSHWGRHDPRRLPGRGVTRLYTEDIGSPRAIDGIELINPFA